MLIPAVSGVIALASGGLLPGCLLLALAALLAWCFWTMRPQLALCSKLLSLSALGLEHNPVLLGMVALTKMAVGAVAVGSAAFMTAAAGNGELAPATCSRSRADGTLEAFACCSWTLRAWVPPYLALAALFGVWSLFLAFEFVVFSVGGVIAQWYYSPLGRPPVGHVKRTVLHALGPSFGTLCYASLVLTAVEAVRSAVQKARERATSVGGSIAGALVGCLADCLAALVQQLTKFTTIHAAIKGGGFCDSAFATASLLARNLLSSYTVFWLPGMVLTMAAAMMAAVAGCAAYLLSLLSFRALMGPTPTAVHAATLYAAAVGVGGFVVSALVLSLLAKLLLNVVDAVYICYALDLDAALVSQPQVHDLFMLLPVRLAEDGSPLSPQPQPGGSYVTQPDGGGAYAPAAVVPPAPYPPAGYAAAPVAGYALPPPGYPPQQGYPVAPIYHASVRPGYM